MKNFIHTLVTHIEQLEMDYPVRIGIFDDEKSLMIKPISGSEVIHEYMNGDMDIRLPFEISIKSKNQEEAYNFLNDVMTHLKNINNFLTRKNDHTLLDLTMEQIPTFLPSEDDYIYYSVKLTADLTHH